MTTEQPNNPADAWKPDPKESYSKVNYLKVKDGEDVDVRILDSEPRQVFMVRIPVKGKQHPATLSKEDNELIKAHNETIKKDDDKLKIRKVNAVNVLDRRDGQVKLWEFSEKLKGEIHTIMGRWKKGVTEFDVTVSRTGTTKNDTRYSVNITPNQNPLTAEELALEKVDLTEYYKSNPERLKSLLRGEVPKRKEDMTDKKVETAVTVPPPQENPLEKGENVV